MLSGSACKIFSGIPLQTLLEDRTITSRPPHDVVRSRLEFDQTDSYWWDTTGVVLSKLMTQAGYPLAVHYKALAFLYDNVLQAWGPIPHGTDGQSDGRPWKATFLEDGSNFEPSLNLSATGTTETCVRFTIECNSALSGTSEDILNQKATHALIMRCADALPDFDLTVYNYMVETLMCDDKEALRLIQDFPTCRHPQILFAFDFERSGRILGKCVPFLYWKSHQLGITRKALATKFISGVPEVGPHFAPCLAAWNDFMVSVPAELGGEPTTECMNFDVVKPGKNSRIKIYIRPHKTSFNCAKYFYTLGGLLNDDATLEGIRILRIFYEVLLDIKEGEEDKELTTYQSGSGSLLFNCAFRPGAALPIPQFYITIWKFMPSNAVIMERLTAFWRRIGWNQQAEKYAQDWQDTFPWVNASECGNTTVLSFAYKAGGSGIYQSVYYSPMAHVAAERLGYV
ncbi:hypothetical protein DPSP01_013831 [Paraphaeosphaeria sporulosa]|uniref:Aromatic prenyltransferase n=1 Tax=Paraphaeosphaeria sporulosa TaxID=1460663 RepID=A0A177CFT8_9PLEO|nr:aromatic prenyltransferase [Paraphaeosphaeria sporulosa]OAG06186.1 aromatic prenyltransferase [Paraphaeosphaeria sporulosa]